MVQPVGLSACLKVITDASETPPAQNQESPFHPAVDLNT